MAVRVGVFDENEVFRRGVVACLSDDDAVHVEAAAAAPDDTESIDVAVVSASVAATGTLRCSMIVCGAWTGTAEQVRAFARGGSARIQR